MKTLKLLTAALVFISLAAEPARAEVYLEWYIGNAFPVTAPNPVDLTINPAFRGPAVADLEYPRTVSSNLITGGKLGTWFVKEGFLGFDYPPRMKYLGFYLDFNYHTIDYLPGVGSRRMYVSSIPPPLGFQHYKFLGTGSIATIAFMFAFRYGFFPKEKVPFGKLQPYIAVGPAVFITSLRPTLMIQPNYVYEFFPTANKIPGKYSGSYQSSVVIGLATELGLRYMITRFLSVETSFKYRYACPSQTFDISILGFEHELRYAPQLNLFSVQIGVAYHF